MTIDELAGILETLARRRTIFHSEADFQHALAWEIHLAHAEARVRLETRPFAGQRSQRLALDMAVSVGGVRTALELKYLVRALSCQVEGERFDLQAQAAQDIRRYDVVKDIRRVEELLEHGLTDNGFVVVIANDPGYWRRSLRPTVDEQFRLHDGRTLRGELRWGKGAGAGTVRGRDEAILLRAEYRLGWRDYSIVAPVPGGTFKYLLIPVPRTVMRTSATGH